MEIFHLHLLPVGEKVLMLINISKTILRILILNVVREKCRGKKRNKKQKIVMINKRMNLMEIK